ncbi:metal-binding protein [Candidatus Dojkabacteria bacterium]|jgi:uncharacterized metal-binding protein|nr:metal-binding protein [Candidatus Dojkabacteria bacterium]
MPNGRTHDRINLILLPIILIASTIILKSIPDVLIISAAYLFSSFMFNGDLDTNSSVYNRWWLMKIIWIPYQLIFTHRSIFTHGILIGTIIRILYLGIIPFIILHYNQDINIIDNIISTKQLILGFIGLELGNTIHTISDKIF